MPANCEPWPGKRNAIWVCQTKIIAIRIPPRPIRYNNCCGYRETEAVAPPVGRLFGTDARGASRLHRGVDGHHRSIVVRHHHAGAGLRHPQRLDGGDAADRRSRAGRQTRLRPSGRDFPARAAVPRRAAGRHHRVPLPAQHQRRLREARHRRARRPHPLRQPEAHPER